MMMIMSCDRPRQSMWLTILDYDQSDKLREKGFDVVNVTQLVCCIS